jgi:hypothetical protein
MSVAACNMSVSLEMEEVMLLPLKHCEPVDS